jgi:aspartate aminotransferase
VKRYPYWNAKTKKLDFDNMIQKLETEAVSGDIVLLHACAHNPTGVDPTKDQWKAIADVCERNGLFPFFDCA